MKCMTKLVVGMMTVTLGIGGAVAIGTSFTIREVAVSAQEEYNGHEKIKGTHGNVEFYYSDGLFEVKPHLYNTAIAACGMTLVDAATTYINNGDYTDGAKNIKELYKQIGFDNYYINDGFVNKPTADSIGFIIGEKNMHLNRKGEDVTVLATTIRSANYELEWASNVMLGKTGEAQGFAEAAKQVKESIDNYLTNNGLEDDYKEGKVLFWINGFSRGGATANLTAKKLIDQYQPFGNDVIAYCYEAPQGAVASEELQGRDYRTIHNVVNPNDIVPYVAPSEFGFKRYGVDHYLLNTKWDSENLIKSTQFPNNMADNEPTAFAPKDYVLAMREQLAKLVPDRSKRAENAPYELHYQSIDVLNLGIEWIDNGENLDQFIKRFMDNLGKSTSREEFVDGGLQKALRDLMVYVKGGGDLEIIKKAFGGLDGVMVVKDLVIPAIVEVIYTAAKNAWDTIVNVITGEARPEYRLSEGFRERIAMAVVDRVKTKEDVCDKLDKEYPGKTEQALKDIQNAVYYALGGLEYLDDVITMGFEAENIIHNHSMAQAQAWLRGNCSWYEDSRYQPMW